MRLTRLEREAGLAPGLSFHLRRHGKDWCVMLWRFQDEPRIDQAASSFFSRDEAAGFHSFHEFLTIHAVLAVKKLFP